MCKTRSLTSQIRPSEDSSIEQLPPMTRSNNIQNARRTRSPSVAPIRSLNTRAVPPPSSISSFQLQTDQAQPLRSPPPESKAAYTLHASIAKLERLVHEATRLAENAIWHDQENRIEARPPPQVESVESANRHSKFVRSRETTAKTLSTRSPAIDSFHAVKPNINSVTSLPTIKAEAAEPVLTLPQSKSAEDVAWTTRATCADHESREDDILEHLRDAVCLQSRQGSIESLEADRKRGKRPETPARSTSSEGKDAMQPTTVHFNKPPAIRNEEVTPATPSAVSTQPLTAQANDSPTFRFTVEDADEHKELDFLERRKSLSAIAVPVKQGASVARKPLRQSTTTLGSLAGGTLEQTSTRRQTSKRLGIIPPQPHPTLDPGEGGLLQRVRTGHERHYSTVFGLPSRQVSMNLSLSQGSLAAPKIDLRRKSYVDVYHEGEAFNVHDTCHHATVARNWPDSRKRFTASIACINTSCIGLLIGIYAGEVPAIQYAIADFGHYSILGNVLMYIGLAISSFVSWPLPLLHGRKPYTIAAVLTALVLQVPQGLAVAGYRDPDVPAWKCLLLTSRAISGLALGLSDMNLKAMLLDCFGASLKSHGDDPLDIYDVRRHGGGIGLWLGFVTWSAVGPISIGFMVGASIIDHGASVSWGSWASLCILFVVLLLNIIVPEVRRSAFRRTIAEMTGEAGGFSRVTREVLAGLQLCGRMIRQPGFLVLSVYTGWVYAQYSLVLMLIGTLASKDYRYTPVYVGLCALAPALGAILAVPFQRASYFSRSRTSAARTDSFTTAQRCKWSSHFIRRLLFMVLLPICAGGYAGSSFGPPLLVATPCVMAGLVGFFTTMATAECYGLMMETFDTTDLQPGMTGRPLRGSVDVQTMNQRTNFSCHPRVSAGFAITNAISYVLAACATAVCGRVERREGTVWAMTVVAVISLVLTLVLTLVLVKWRKVQMIPDGPTDFEHIRRANTSWRPVNVGRGSGKFRRLSVLDMGSLTRYSEIRERNRVEGSLSGGLRTGG